MPRKSESNRFILSFLFKKNQDGNYYIKLLDESTNHINELCNQYRVYVDESDEANYVTNEEGRHSIFYILVDFFDPHFELSILNSI